MNMASANDLSELKEQMEKCLKDIVGIDKSIEKVAADIKTVEEDKKKSNLRQVDVDALVTKEASLLSLSVTLQEQKLYYLKEKDRLSKKIDALTNKDQTLDAAIQAIEDGLSPERKTDFLHSFQILKSRNMVDNELLELPTLIVLSKAKKLLSLRLIARVFFGQRFKWNFDALNLYAKCDGVQIGAVVEIVQGLSSTRYYVKTHQNGGNIGDFNQMEKVDTREVFVYKVIELLGIGPPEVLFYMNPIEPADFYIATKEIPNFRTFENLASEEFLKTINQKTNGQYSSSAKYGIVLLSLVSKIFYLRDVANNYDNFGFNDQLEAKMVDFIIVEDIESMKDAVEMFCKPNISLSTKTGMEGYFQIDSNSKVEFAKRAFCDELKDLSQVIDKAYGLTTEFFKKTPSRIFRQDFARSLANLGNYVACVRANINAFNKRVCSA